MRTSSLKAIVRLAGAIGLALSLGVGTVLAKEGVSVDLLAPLPRDAEPGSNVSAMFKMSAISDDVASPLHKASVFIRLYGPTGAMTEGAGVEQKVEGVYVAKVEVPEGGIARMEFGIHGAAKTSTGKVVATDPVWAYDGEILTPAAVNPNPVNVQNPKPATVPAAAPPATVPPTPTAAAGQDLRIAALGAAAVAAAACALIVASRRRAHGSPA
jgi:hypothetical protein